MTAVVFRNSTSSRFVRLSSRRKFRLLLRGLLLTTVLIAGYAITLFVDFALYVYSAYAMFVLLLASAGEFVFADYIAERRYPVETERKLALLEDQLGANAVRSLLHKLERTIGLFGGCDHSQISGTVHVIVDLSASAEATERKGLMQLTDYVGTREGGKGRITILERGIIGRCARSGKLETVNFADQDEYNVCMVREFGYTPDEARAHTVAARSYLAQPLLSTAERQPIGVLYFFSTEPNAFPASARDTNLEAIADDIVDLLKTVSMV